MQVVSPLSTGGSAGDPVSKNGRKPDSEADVPVWTPTVTRPISHGGYRTRHSLDRYGAGGRTTRRMLDRCTGVPWAPRGGKRCVLCQRLPSTTTLSLGAILPKRAMIVQPVSPDAVQRFSRFGAGATLGRRHAAVRRNNNPLEGRVGRRKCSIPVSNVRPSDRHNFVDSCLDSYSRRSGRLRVWQGRPRPGLRVQRCCREARRVPNRRLRIR